MPKLSVVMPLYNAEKYVEKAIYSILKQTYKDFELVLVDDCSTDKTMEIVSGIKDERINILKNERNFGIAYSRNKALKACTGEYIALMDDDDIATIDRFEKQVTFLDEHDEIDVVGSRYSIIDRHDAIKWTLPEVLHNPLYIRAALMFYDPIPNGSTMFRNDFIRSNKIQYKENCFGMEDYLFWIECSLHGKITNLEDVFLYWRDSGENESSRMHNNNKEKRANKYAELQKYAIQCNGFKLLEEELELLTAMFPEGNMSKIVTRAEIEKLYEVFRKLIYQAEENGFENKNEVRILCRKQFSKRIEYSELWT